MRRSSFIGDGDVHRVDRITCNSGGAKQYFVLKTDQLVSGVYESITANRIAIFQRMDSPV
jgi:hypothetical protein